MSLRDSLGDYTPRRFADALPDFASWGWRTLWSVALSADAFTAWSIQGLRARLPGVGTPTALSVISRDRAIVRGRVESEADHVARLANWLELHESRARMVGMTREVQNYLGRTNGGQWHTVACVSRRGTWGIRRASGEYEYHDPGTLAVTWDWDSVSHPERAALWSDMWIIVWPPGYEPHVAQQWPGPDSSYGHDAPQTQVATLRELVTTWRAGRTRVRALIWAPLVVPAGYPNAGSPCLDPTAPAPFMADGTWGECHKYVDGASVPSRPKFLRFWEF